MAYLIDTSLLIADERGDVVLPALLDEEAEYVLSVVSAAELLHGVHRSSGRRAARRSAYVEGPLSAFTALPIDVSVARAYARESAALARSGTPDDANDLWIGATAIAHGSRVLSIDGDFARIPGVTLSPVGG